jgi:hypothetical protein
MEHNNRIHKYEWMRVWGPIHFHTRRERKHYKQKGENGNIREHAIKMHPNQKIRG